MLNEFSLYKQLIERISDTIFINFMLKQRLRFYKKLVVIKNGSKNRHNR
ncbi:hypothetical protein T190820D02B_30045 [Tenacibaculum sp. 190524A05c]